MRGQWLSVTAAAGCSTIPPAGGGLQLARSGGARGNEPVRIRVRQERLSRWVGPEIRLTTYCRPQEVAANEQRAAQVGEGICSHEELFDGKQ